MAKGEYSKLVKHYKQAAIDKYKSIKALQKSRRKQKLSLKERFDVRMADRQSVKDWKAEIKGVSDKKERHAQKKGYRAYKRRQSLPWKIAILVAVVLVFGGLFGRWYYVATRPLSAEQQVARERSLAVAKQVQAEGSVLLRNENNLLPLKKGNVSVFGTSSVSMVLGGGGAGGVAATNARSLQEAFIDNGLDYDKDIYNIYGNYLKSGVASAAEFKKPRQSLIGTLLPSISGFLATAPKEMPADQLPDGALNKAAGTSDTAIYVVSRVGTETKDLAPDDLRLNDDEKDTLQKLDNKFEHVVLLLNTTNPIELGFVNDMEHIDAVLWVGSPGEVGVDSIAKILVGDINPSGRLTDTYTYNIEDNPAVVNTGEFAYKDIGEGQPKRYFVDYSEGIYTGYRYFETFVDKKDYGSIVQYPFGHGLSYTNFDWKIGKTTANKDNISVEVAVKNTGDRSGKDVVEVYFKPPYEKGGIEKPAKVLAGYAKTGVIDPGESQTVTVEFATRDMASFDETDAKAYVLDKGNYQIVVGRNVHDEVDKFDYEQTEKQVFKTDAKTNSQVTTRFDDSRGIAKYISRSDNNALPKAPTDDEYKLRSDITDADYKHVASDQAEPTVGANNGIKLSDLKGLDYDDPKWDKFLDQFNEKELVKMAGDGGYWSLEVERLGVPKTTMYDGPASIRSFLGSWSTVAYPIPLNLASAWNDDLSQKVGAAMGDEAQSFGTNATYAPSLNLHRSPLGGRNFEYYSEDPLLAGKTGAAVVRGLQSSGTVAIIKHFVANDQETHRGSYGLYTWMNEQSLRELYLRPFQIAVQQGDAHGVMSAFNRVGPIWAGGSKPLLTDVLRNEWGFKGFVITDAGVAGQGKHFDALQATEAGNDMMLAFLIDLPADNNFEKQLKQYLKEDRAGTLIALRNSAHNICYYVLQTTAVED